jgi:hypothetical protein
MPRQADPADACCWRGSSALVGVSENRASPGSPSRRTAASGCLPPRRPCHARSRRGGRSTPLLGIGTTVGSRAASVRASGFPASEVPACAAPRTPSTPVRVTRGSQSLQDYAITFLRSWVSCPAGGAIAHVDRSRVHTSETAALSGRPLAGIALAARSRYPHEALPDGVHATMGYC